MNELRPCIVRKQKSAAYERYMPAAKKPEEHKGYFHKWSERFWTIGESPMTGGHAAGQMSQTVAIVEYEDGTVHEHLPSEIQFMDREEKNEIQKETSCG